MRSSDPVNLTNCDREPIHIPGSIQPHGCLIACDIQAGNVLRYSENCAEMLGIPSLGIGDKLGELIGSNATHDIRNALAAAPQASRPALLPRMRLENGKVVDIAAHRFAGHAIIEFEEADLELQPLQLTRELIGRIRTTTDTQKLLRMTTNLLKAVLGYDRVMLYRFEQDGAGKVESEAKRPDLESFLGQYFPASDIPQQARQLYINNPIRIISDARGDRSVIHPVLNEDGEPLDLSHAHLRSVSPIHLEYLRNMGVAASMSVSIVVDGELWGLIACHHYSPKILTLPQRVAAEMFGEFFSMHLIGLLQQSKLDVVTEARKSLDRFLTSATEELDVSEVMERALPDFREMIACDGIGLYLDTEYRSLGISPPESAIENLATYANTEGENRIWSTSSLSAIYEAAEPYYKDVSGVLFIPLSKVSGDCLMFFRKERLETLNWAGNPDKLYEAGPLGDRLTPRKSFSIWKETVDRMSETWTEAEHEIAAAIQSATVEVVLRHNQLMQEERHKAELRQRLLNEELNHRVKNILAVIKSLIATPARDATSLADYVATLKGRIQALSHAHDQVIRGSGGGDIQGLLEAELSPFSTASAITFNGPKVQLDGRAYAVAALVFHELCTNAAKYGSLSRPKGSLKVEWNLLSDGDLEIFWNETGGPPVTGQSKRGFGTALIERSIPFDLGGESTVSFDKEGLSAQIKIPAKFLTILEKTGHREVRETVPDGQSNLKGIDEMSVLLVEDQVLIAMDVEFMLEGMGVGEVMTANSSRMALDTLKTFSPDVALLDINLGAGTSVPVAEELTRRGIPFIFATGYDDRTALPPELLSVPVVRKPYDASQLQKALTERLATSGESAEST